MRKVLSLLILISFMFFIMQAARASSNISVMEQNASSLVKLGIMKGYEDGTLKLDNKIKRSEFITLIVKMMSYDKNADLDSIKITFTDLNKKHWAYTNIKLALKNEIVTGYPNNTIAPDKDVTYAEALAVVIRALGYEKTLTGKWPSNVVNKGTELGLNKNLSLDSNHQLTRGEMSVIVYNALTVNFATN